ncbi:hypothetical protein [Stagnihabitans tardus]|uniref:Uncharacterized protein n=1 Tax=Stagnihabitans tardus TaxID=2699202 RepID=A0AAE4Y8G4_9RHOB|nr:hypothetical protein [Stagnihabitans tardus]NBZ87916.1 hypothetical protein [Stagnihabitans tardus]
MTDYSAIAETETDPGAPSKSSLWKRWAKNWIAGFEGAAGAPRLMGEAIATAANGALPVLTVTASDAFDLGEGMAPVAGTAVATTAAEVVAQTYTVALFTGSVRVRATITAGGGGVATAILYKNGVSFGSSTTSSQSYDVPVVPGDVLQWRHKTNGTGTSTFSGAVARASNSYLPQSAFRKAV